MYSGREGVLGVEKAPSKMNRSKALDKVVQWLVERGVERKRARQFIIKCAFFFLSFFVSRRLWCRLCTCLVSMLQQSDS